ncbi:MAG: ABC transporter ATP-binding protein [Deltaproteobacteria bacterium]|nr:ABC transporter ATP-binding protein [Deltaproteobacteria bacterium]
MEGVTKRYRQGDVMVEALRGVNLTLAEGEFSALVGPSGSGKTTLLNMIGALDKPTSGRVSLNGTDLTQLSGAKLSAFRLHQVGFVFQAYNLVPVLTALENVAFVMVLQGRPPKEIEQRAMHYLERVELADLAHRRPKAMSGGQQQRVAVARALAAEPRLVLADEPTANLDTHTAFDLLDLMHELNREEKMTFLFSTHDQRVLERASRVISLHDGKIEEG